MKTIKINTADLSGAALDWSVAVAIGKDPVVWDVCCGNMAERPAECCLNPFVSVEVDMAKWSPSTDWSQGGPLIEKYYVSFYGSCTAGEVQAWSLCLDSMTESDPFDGDTHLIAAMRSIVALKLDGTVDVPAELVEIAP